MNALQIINLIPEIVAARPTSGSDKWILMIIDNKIQCVAADGEQCEGFPLMPINLTHVNKGFHGREWDRLTNRIEAYQKKHPKFMDNAWQNTTEPQKTQDPESATIPDEAKTNQNIE